MNKQPIDTQANGGNSCLEQQLNDLLTKIRSNPFTEKILLKLAIHERMGCILNK